MKLIFEMVKRLAHTEGRLRRIRKTAAVDPTPGKLIDAAGRIFAERGYHAVTVREICSRAGTNVASVNYHFGGKLGLYTEVLKQSVRAAKAGAIRQVLDQHAPPEQILRGVIRTRLQNARGADLQDWHFRIMIHEMAQPTPALSRVIHEVTRPIYERVLKLVGAITGMPAHHERTRLCVHSVMGQVLLYVLQRPLLERLWPELKMTPAQLDRIADHIADFSLAYLRGPGSGQCNAKRGDKNGKRSHS